VIQDDEHLLTVLRYIEANPLRAGIVTDLRDYPWCSYPTHGLGCAQAGVNALPTWQTLAATEEARLVFWRDLVHTPLTARELAAVRRSVTTGRPFGAPGWVEATARALGIPLATRPRGRPSKK
jgi:putative transposase